MLANRKKKIALIHVARKELRLDDAAYRALLFGAAGIGSLTELEDDTQFKNIMEAFKSLGFISKKSPQPKPEDVWGGTEAQREKTETIWQMCARDKSEEALRKFIKRVAKVDHPRFLTVMLARKVITAMESMALNYGYDPATGQKLAQGE